MGGYISFVRIQPGEAMRSPQEIFTFVIESLKAQGKRAIDTDGKCRLRGEGGTKCAVGFLIPDSEYSPELDTDDFLCSEKTKNFPEISENRPLMNDLMMLHDMELHWDFPSSEKPNEDNPFSPIGLIAIKNIAKDRGFTTPDWV